MVQYYTLQEAAAKLHLSPETLKEMAKNGELRAFQDRGSLRFRAQEVDELARLRGHSSEPDLQLGDAPAAPPESPRTPKPAPAQQKSEPSVFDFTLGTEDSDEVSLGQDLTPSSSKDVGRKSGPPKTSPPKSGLPKSPQPRSASGMHSPPPSASDSDVRLVSDGTGLDFQVELDRGAQVEHEPPSSHRSGSSRKSKTKADQVDSGVRIVPLDQSSDSDVKMVPDPTGSGAPSGSKVKRPNTPSDSDIRLEHGSSAKQKEDALVTEEIDLDAESRKAEEAAKGSSVDKSGNKPKRTQIGPGGQTPFELSGPEATRISHPPSAGKSGARPPVAKKDPDTSSEFELTSAPPKSSVIKPTGSKPPGTKPPGASGTKAPKTPSPKAPPADDVPVLMGGDEDVNLGELTGAGGGSGINLKDPADSGISLEQGGSDEIEFELSLDSAAKTPQPKTPQPSADEKGSSSSNEFELSLDEGSSSDSDSDSDSDSESEFELSLDVPEGSSVKVEDAPDSDSDSEFELTLDEAGGIAPVEESDSDSGEPEVNKDIFETDFEVPALDEGSDSEAVALEESDSSSSSDFELDLTEEPPSDGETGSQVVALDDGGEADEGAETVAKPRRKAAAVAAALSDLEDEDTALDEDIEGDLEEEPETEAETVYVPAPAAEWGVLPAIFLIPTVIVLFITCLMTFELVQGIWSFHRGGAITGPVTHAVAGMFTDLPKPKD
jgi:excisionase family DNA binding protein